VTLAPYSREQKRQERGEAQATAHCVEDGPPVQEDDIMSARDAGTVHANSSHRAALDQSRAGDAERPRVGGDLRPSRACRVLRQD